MASIPTFDYLTITKNNLGYLAKYVVTSSNTNYSTQVQQFESFNRLLEIVNNYLKNAVNQPKGGPIEGPIRENQLVIPMIQIYSDSITIRFKSLGGLRDIKLPIRENLRQQMKTPFLTVGDQCEQAVTDLVRQIDELSRG